MNAVVENGVVFEPDPIEKLKLTVSASRLNCWLQCRLKFFFRYVLKISKPKTPALHYGSVLHLVLQQWNLARWRKQPFDLAKLKLVFDVGWADQGQIDWEGEELEQKTSAWAVLEKYFTATPIKNDEMPEAVEVWLGEVGGSWTSNQLAKHLTTIPPFIKTVCSSIVTAFYIGKALERGRLVGNCITSSKPRHPK